MRNVVPDFDPPEVRATAAPDCVRHVLEFQVITPIFGGGVRPREADPISVVRVPGIVGHLRSWWRVCRGAAFKSVSELKRRENELWGSTDQRSQIVLSVRVTEPGEAVDSHRLPNRGTFAQADDSAAPGYVSFPLQPKMNRAGQWEGPWKLRRKVSFELEVSAPASEWSDLEAALWAWEHFGGIGARTRRGFGALACVKRDGVAVSPSPAVGLADELKKGIDKYVVPGGKGTPKGLSWMVGSALVVTNVHADPHVAWSRIIESYRCFRQSRNGQCDPRRPSRSDWPEPDMLRREYGTHSPGHQPVHPVLRYPRADFGLPILFQFKDKRQGDPETVTLQGLDHERRASPMLLRPHICEEGAVAIAVLLVPFGSPPGGYRLKGRSTGVRADLKDVAEQDLRRIKPLVGADGKVREPFDALFHIFKRL